MGIFDKLFGKKEQRNEPKEPVQNSEKLMNADQFWKIIATSKANSSGDYEKQQTELEKELLKLTAIEILEFDNKFRKLRGEVYNWNFWAGAYIINGGCSDDCFSDFRGWLIGQGKAIFESAIQDIETLAELNKTNDGDWEGLSYIPTDAYEKKTGNEMPNGIQESLEISGEEWNEEGDDLKNKFPKLWAKFGME
ncbi:DUF4240 domain-containing protein [Formosa undariae]|uniref:DUF4240 domain-containing protein n=1 Tax=Formosa undariae TaxID=1325436 RepID=A0ABV5F5C8_9FLAO